MKSSTTEISKAWQFSFVIMLGIAFIMLPDLAFAAPGTQTSTVGTALCSIADDFQGQIAAAIATIAICTIGTLACLGRVQWTSAIVVATGIAVLMGASTLVSSVAGVGC